MLLDNLLPSFLGAVVEPKCFYHRLKYPDLVSFGLYASLKKMHANNIIGAIDSIWDVGANKGQFAFMAHQIWPNLPIYSFEPDPESFNHLEFNLKKHSINGKAFPYALSDKSEEKQLIQYEDSVNNSILENKLTPNKLIGHVNVTCSTLDEMSQNLPPVKAAFLKLDVQGYELIVLAGAKNFLTNCKFIQIEVSFLQTYKTGAHAGEVITQLFQLGFECIEIIDLLRSKADSNKITEADLLFKRVT